MKVKAYPKTYYEEYENQGYRLKYFKDTITPLREWHYHDFYEVSIILESRGVSYVTEEKEYKLTGGDVIFCNVFEVHHFKIESERAYCERFNIGIEFTRLLGYSSQDANLPLLFQKNRQNYPVTHLEFNSLLKYYELIRLYNHQKVSCGVEKWERGIIQLLFSYLYNDAYNELEASQENFKNLSVVNAVVEYINQHYWEALSLEKLAKEVNYSVSYICSAFRVVMNKSITNYIKEKRLERAIQYVRAGMPIVEASEKAGFNNYSNFYKTFKQVYGMAPSEYRELDKK